MSRIFVLVMGFVLIVLVTSLALAVHYRHQSEYYRQQWEATLAKLTTEPVVTNVASATPERTRVVYVKEPVASGAGDVALRERLVNLEHQLAEKDSQLAAFRSAATNSSSGSRSSPDRMMAASRRWTNDVPGRAEFEKRRQEIQQTIQNAYAKKAAFLLNRDTSKMSEGERKEYDRMVGLLDETWKMSAQMQQPDAPWDQRREAMHTIRDNVRELDPLLTSERTRQFRDLGTSLGYSGPEADNFVNYISDIIEVTDVSSMTPHFHGGGGSGGTRSGGGPSGSTGASSADNVSARKASP
jgi:hypothetical protein